jgi:hypothetical protein
MGVGLNLLAGLAATACATADSDVLLKPIKTTGTPVGLILVQVSVYLRSIVSPQGVSAMKSFRIVREKDWRVAHFTRTLCSCC